MGGHVSKKPAEASSSINLNNNLQYTTELSSYEAACRLDEDLQSFDTSLQVRTNHVINTLAVGVEVRALSFDSLKEVTECLLEMNQEVVKVILECKKDIWKNQELFELVEEYFENSLQTLDFCTALEKCLKRARDSQLLILVAIQQFEEESEAGGNRYVKTLEGLKNFKTSGDPFTEEFFQIFQSVYRQQILMLEKLQLRKNKLDKKLNRGSSYGCPSCCSCSCCCNINPSRVNGKWIDSLWKNYENALKGQKELISTMQVGTYVAVKDLDNIRVLIDRLEIDIEALMLNAEFAIEEEAVKVAIEEIKKKLEAFMKHVEELGVQADTCSRDIRRARTVVLQRIIKHPNN
ncbi:hypothetical protein GH714_040157 [Hevea brasiliensis]|uniref:Uncharacterized protein n=1 Tax=Hevea brasiliensis TaxID=3981 RepID=A0A6A6KM25_HEVBR|nr:hypothetical protein GH714_040157 [Hevea brasiliensis]